MTIDVEKYKGLIFDMDGTLSILCLHTSKLGVLPLINLAFHLMQNGCKSMGGMPSIKIAVEVVKPTALNSTLKLSLITR